jgi:hypothetical protein
LPNIFAEIRKYGVGVTASHQWLAQTGRQDDPIREAICNGPNIKVVFRVRNPREAAELAESVIPLDLEMPVRALIKPAVVGHRRTLMGNATSGTNYAHSRAHGQSVSHNSSKTHTDGVAHGTSESTARSVTNSTARSLSKSTAHSVTHSEADTTGESVTESVSRSSGESHTISKGETITRGSSTGSSRDSSTTSTADFIPEAITTTEGNGSSSSSDRSRSHSTGESWSTSEVETRGTAVSRSKAHTVGFAEGHTTGRGVSDTVGRAVSDTVGNARSTTNSQSVAQSSGRSIGTSLTEGTTSGTSESRGFSEAIEPIYRDLPTAVHGKDNALHFAAQELLSLPTGAARLAYVGEGGRAVARLQVPLVAHAGVSDDEFQALRGRILQRSPAASPFSDAMARIKGREARLIKEAGGLQKPALTKEEPTSFRVPAPKKRRRDA